MESYFAELSSDDENSDSSPPVYRWRSSLLVLLAAGYAECAML